MRGLEHILRSDVSVNGDEKSVLLAGIGEPVLAEET